MPSEKQIEAAADQISEGLGAFLRKFCDSEASKRARYYLHEMPKDEWNQMALMLATEALTAAEQAEPAPATLEAERDRLKESVAELEKALEPFAREAEDWSPQANGGHVFDDAESIAGETSITVGHLRTARAYRDKGRE